MKVKKINLPGEYVELWNYYNPSMPFFVGMIGSNGSERNPATKPSQRFNFRATGIAYMKKGSGTVSVNGASFSVSEGDVFLLPKYSDHTCVADDSSPWEVEWIVVDGKLVDSLLELYLPRNRLIIENFNAEYVFSGMKDLLRTYNDNIDQFVKYATLLFFSFIVDLNFSLQRAADSVAYKVKQMLDYNSHRNLTIKDIAESLHYSVNYVIRSFKKEFNMTPAQYYIRRKIELAEMYLRTSEETVCEISDKLNFIDQHYFANVFKRMTGTTPSRYRAQFRQNM